MGGLYECKVSFPGFSAECVWSPEHLCGLCVGKDNHTRVFDLFLSKKMQECSWLIKKMHFFPLLFSLFIFFFFSICHFPINLPETRKQTFRVLLHSPRPPSAAAVSRCQVSVLAAWRTSRCWRPSWGPIPTVIFCMWWTPDPRSACCEKQPYSMFLYIQVGLYVFKLRRVSWMFIQQKTNTQTHRQCDCAIM